MADRIYLDHAAATPIRAEAMAAMAEGIARWANPSSPHAEGRAARAALERARGRIADAFGWRHDLIFTSGASEALDIALNRQPRPVVASAVEHPAVFRLRPDAAIVPVDGDGLVDTGRLSERLGGAPLVALQAANSETGVLQPLDSLAPSIAEGGGVLLADCSQSAGKRPLPEADLIILSAHKLGGPPGAGALLVRDPVLLRPTGGQERGYRPGTENLPAILGFAAAIEAMTPLADAPAWRTRLDGAVLACGGSIVAAGAPRLAEIGAYRLPGLAAATLLIRLDMAGFSISAGSACSSGSLHTSPVLQAMGVPDEAAREVFRVSFGHTTTARQIEAFATALAGIVADMGGRT